MYLQQKLNPQPADPTQAKIFLMLPIVFTFMLGQFPAGLVIYWAWNNLLSIAQQWIIMRQMGVTMSGQTVALPGSKTKPDSARPPARNRLRDRPRRSGAEGLHRGGAAEPAQAPSRQQQAQTAEAQGVLNRGRAVGEAGDASGAMANDAEARAAMEHGRRLFAGRCDFVAGIASIDALPPAALPEIAFAGRSNVGKSTLINALTGRRSLARTSRTRGARASSTSSISAAG